MPPTFVNLAKSAENRKLRSKSILFATSARNSVQNYAHVFIATKETAEELFKPLQAVFFVIQYASAVNATTF